MFSAKRGVSISLWPPGESDEFDFARSSVRVQEVTIENGKLQYGQSMRLPASEKTLLVARYLEDFAVEGRALNREYQSQHPSATAQASNASSEEQNDDQSGGDEDPGSGNHRLRESILAEFQGKSVILRTIVQKLLELGYQDLNTDPNRRKEVIQILETLESEGLVRIEQRTAKAGHSCSLYIFEAPSLSR